jgi:hypothetical protein
MSEKDTTSHSEDTPTTVEAIGLTNEALGYPPYANRLYKDGDLVLKHNRMIRSFGQRDHEMTARVMEKGKAIHEVSDSQYGYLPVVQVQSARTLVAREGGKPTRYETSTTNTSRTDYVGTYDFETTRTNESKTTITRHDKKGNEIYRFVSSKPELAKKVASIAIRGIIGEAQKHLDKEKDSTSSIE